MCCGIKDYKKKESIIDGNSYYMDYAPNRKRWFKYEYKQLKGNNENKW